MLSECNLVSDMVHWNPDFCLLTSVVNDKTIDCLSVFTVFSLCLLLHFPFTLVSEPDPLCVTVWFRDYVYSYRCAVHSHVVPCSSSLLVLIACCMEGEELGFLPCDLRHRNYVYHIFHEQTWKRRLIVMKIGQTPTEDNTQHSKHIQTRRYIVY